MNEIKIEEIYRHNYTAKVLNAVRQVWRDHMTYNFIGKKKQQHLFLFLLNCNATFQLKNGDVLFAPNDSLVYIPEESEYKVIFSNCDTISPYNCISINFKIYDETGCPFAFGNNIQVISLASYRHMYQMANDVADASRSALNSPMKTNGFFYILLSELSSYCYVNEYIIPQYHIIAKGIQALEKNCENTLSVHNLAEMCNVSPTYFRKLFKEYSGTSPQNYKLNMLMSQAKQYLLYSDKSVSEIADVLGFTSASYFCRIFKKKIGLTPMQYIQLKNKND